MHTWYARSFSNFARYVSLKKLHGICYMTQGTSFRSKDILEVITKGFIKAAYMEIKLLCFVNKLRHYNSRFMAYVSS